MTTIRPIRGGDSRDPSRDGASLAETPWRLQPSRPMSQDSAAQGQPLGLPWDEYAEAGALGALIVYPEQMDEAVVTLIGEEKDFFSSRHREVYAALLALYRAAEPIDLVTVTDRLRQMGKLDAVDGVAFVSHLTNAAPPSGYLTKYLRIIRQMALRRADIRAAEMILTEAYTCENDEAYAIVRSSVGDALTGAAAAGMDELPILTAEEAEALPPLTGILGDILFDESVSYLYGPSGRWKSFVALDWALSIATGNAWMGRPTQEGDVLYVCSEGARGMGKRITAWKRRHDVLDASRLRLLPLAIDLTNATQVAALPRRLAALDIEPRLIVFDTLAASNTGDENTAENAARITAAARRIIHAHPGACVLIVHHTGYDNTHMRGSTAFYSNADTVIRIEGGEANRRIEPGEPIKLVSDKPKEGEPFADILLTAERQSWADERGVIHTSLVMTPGEEAAAAAKSAKAQAAKLTPQRQTALAVLKAAGDAGMSATAWAKASGMSNGAFYEAVKFFINAELVGINTAGDYYCL